MKVVISARQAPAIGDVRMLGTGDVIVLRAGWTDRRDAARYADAITAAVLKGASVEQA